MSFNDSSDDESSNKVELLNLIEPNLYLGCREAAENLETLKKYNITHILTAEINPLPDAITKEGHFTTKFIRLNDDDYDDLLIHLEDTYAFITEGMSQGTVLVHCAVGRSRSASLILAYMMKKYHLTYKEAEIKVEQKRKVWPHYSYVEQLKLYQRMGCQLVHKFRELDEIAEKLYYLRRSPNKCVSMPEEFLGIITPDPETMKTEPEPQLGVYRCSKCSRALACDSNVLRHRHNGEICEKSFFVMPSAWMQGVTEKIQNELYCPSCDTKVGLFDWTLRYRITCTCGFRTCPAFCLKSPEVKSPHHLE